MDYISEWPEDVHPYGKPDPCKFCGADQDFTTFYYNGEGPPPSYVFSCGHCGATGPHSRGREADDHFGAREDAIQRWNTGPRGVTGAEVEKRALALAAASQCGEALPILMEFAREGESHPGPFGREEPIEKLADALKLSIELAASCGETDEDRDQLLSALVRFLEGWAG